MLRQISNKVIGNFTDKRAKLPSTVGIHCAESIEGIWTLNVLLSSVDTWWFSLPVATKNYD